MQREERKIRKKWSLWILHAYVVAFRLRYYTDLSDSVRSTLPLVQLRGTTFNNSFHSFRNAAAFDLQN